MLGSFVKGPDRVVGYALQPHLTAPRAFDRSLDRDTEKESERRVDYSAPPLRFPRASTLGLLVRW